MEHETIKRIQGLLIKLGESPGEVDGWWGVRSDAALNAACKRYGVTADHTTAAENPTAMFWKEIRYVPRVEWRCPCGRCGGFPVEPQEKIVRFLEDLRVHFNKPVYISSGVRCQAHNDELPGSVFNSRHLSGKAVDFCVEGMSATSVKVYCDKKVADGTLRYCYSIDNSFIHADIL